MHVSAYKGSALCSLGGVPARPGGLMHAQLLMKMHHGRFNKRRLSYSVHYSPKGVETAGPGARLCIVRWLHLSGKDTLIYTALYGELKAGGSRRSSNSRTVPEQSELQDTRVSRYSVRDAEARLVIIFRPQFTILRQAT